MALRTMRTAMNSSRQSRRRASPRAWPWTLWLIVGVLGVAVLLAGLRLVRQSALVAWRQNVELPGGPHWPDWNPQWPPLPPPPANPVIGEFRASYAYAATRPEILQHIPCYCGCQRLGHQSNADCYVRGHTATGQPMWTDHAYTCDVCLNITRDVALLMERGHSLKSARAIVDEQYTRVFGTGTATPLP